MAGDLLERDVVNLLGILRDRELLEAGSALERKTGLAYRPTHDGEQVGGIYRQAVNLANGRFAMLDDGTGFRLVPWRPVIEPRLGQQLAVVVCGQSVSWQIGHGKAVER